MYKQIKKLIDYLHDCGYQPETIQQYIQKVEHFGIWLKTNGIKASLVNKDTINSFLNGHLPICRCKFLCSCYPKDVRAALNKLLRVLPLKNQKLKKTCITPVGKEIQRFKAYMSDVCSLSDSTINYRVRNITEFLTDLFGNNQIKYKQIKHHRILRYVSKKAKKYKTGSTKVLTCSLRCYFRFLQFKGKCSRNLMWAVPTVPNWKLANIPQTVTEEQLSKFLASFNLRTPSGQRDYAMALCFIELGLRASEVKDILLDDIDWKNSTIQICVPKTSRSRILPLPNRLGRALARYLKNGRPKTNSRKVFIRYSVPKGKPITIYIVRAAMRSAYKRAGLSEICSGTHVLRHTLATTMYKRGATLKEVADILGHKSIDSTTIYTKLNLTMLAKVAMPWPEVRT
ncbi:MAG: site-specific integrase [Bacteroidales bacterium]